MLTIGQRMNDFIVSAASTRWRAGRPDGAAILGVREDEDGTREYVAAMLGQHEIDRPEPAESWAMGHYFDSGANKNAAADALQDWTERAGMGRAEAPPAAREAMPTARLLDDGRLLCGHDGCEATANRMREGGLTRYWTIELRSGWNGDGEAIYADSGPAGMDIGDGDGDGAYDLECTQGHGNALPFTEWNWD